MMLLTSAVKELSVCRCGQPISRWPLVTLMQPLEWYTRVTAARSR